MNFLEEDLVEEFGARFKLENVGTRNSKQRGKREPSKIYLPPSNFAVPSFLTCFSCFVLLHKAAHFGVHYTDTIVSHFPTYTQAYVLSLFALHPTLKNAAR
mmetsp:Transcript_45277/g.68283  ORF Transcript_45277/g.68283 Transcript_45277/m.68283 type:complete len:101 (-) Transcript_45277:1337-1639(-)